MTGIGSPTSVAPGLAPTAASWGYPHVEVFALTKNLAQSVYWKWRAMNATSDSDFEPKKFEMAATGDSVGVDTAKTPSIALVARFVGDSYRIDVQMTNSGGKGIQTWHTPTQRLRLSNPTTPWFNSSSDFWALSAPVLVGYTKGNDQMTTFFLGYSGTNVCVWYQHLKESVSWTPLTSIEGPNLHTWATPAAVAWNGDTSRLDIFAVAKDNHLLHSFSENMSRNQWSEYEDLGGFITTPPTVVSRAPGCLDVFTRGGDGGLWHLSFGTNQTWSSWRRISGSTRIQGQPQAISSKNTSIDVFAWGEDKGAMLYKTYDSVTDKWTLSDDEFRTLFQSGLLGPPKGVVVSKDSSDNDVYVFAYYEQDSIVWHTIGPNKMVVGDGEIWARVPSDVS